MAAKNMYIIFFIKIIAVFYITFISGITGLFISQIFDKYVFNSNKIETDIKKIDKLSTYIIIIKTFLIVALYGVFSFFFRNIITYIPFPLDGINGFKYEKVKEIASGSVFFIILITFSETIGKLYLQIKKKRGIYH
jgi:ABC-type multidrug transport system fused ATPase/permease subunit